MECTKQKLYTHSIRTIYFFYEDRREERKLRKLVLCSDNTLHCSFPLFFGENENARCIRTRTYTLTHMLYSYLLIIYTMHRCASRPLNNTVATHKSFRVVAPAKAFHRFRVGDISDGGVNENFLLASVKEW